MQSQTPPPLFTVHRKSLWMGISDICLVWEISDFWKEYQLLAHAKSVCAGLYRSDPVCASFCQSEPVCASLCWFLLVCTSLYQFLLVCACLCRFVLVLYWFVLVCTGLCRFVLVCTGRCRLVPASFQPRAGLSLLSPVCTCLQNSILHLCCQTALLSWLSWFQGPPVSYIRDGLCPGIQP